MTMTDAEVEEFLADLNNAAMALKHFGEKWKSVTNNVTDDELTSAQKARIEHGYVDLKLALDML